MKLKILKIEVWNGKKTDLSSKEGIEIDKKDLPGFRRSLRKKHKLPETAEIFINTKETEK